MASATSSRGASSSTNRSPSSLTSSAPSPRTASVTRKPSRSPAHRDGGRVELHELQVGERSARRRGRASGPCRSLRAGSSCAATAPRRRRSRAPSRAAGIAADSVTTPAQRPSSTHSARADAALVHLDRSSSAVDQLRQPRRHVPAGRAAAGVDDAPARVAALQRQQQLAVGRAVERDPEPLQLAHALRRLGAEDLGQRRSVAPRPAGRRVLQVQIDAVVGSSAAASPPCAQ